MSDTVITLPPPELPPPPPPDKFERERRAFYRLLPELLKTHRGQYVAIHEEQVVDSGTDEMALILRVLKRVGHVAIFVGLVTDEPRKPIRIPHYRVLGHPEGTL